MGSSGLYRGGLCQKTVKGVDQVLTKALLQVILTVIGAVVAVWIMVPFIIKRFPTAEQSVLKAHDLVDAATEFGEELLPEYVATFKIIREIADLAVINVEQLIKVGKITDKDEALTEAVKFINGVLKMEGFTDEFITEQASVIEGVTRAAVFVMNFRRDSSKTAAPVGTSGVITTT